MVPDKIYIPLYSNHSLDGVHLGDDWMYEPHKECNNTEYISKEALLEWAKEQNKPYLKEYETNKHISGEHFGLMIAFQQLMDKLNSM